MQLSFLEKNRSNSIKESGNHAEEDGIKSKKGRNFLNGVLESALDSDIAVLTVNDFMAASQSFSVSII